MKRTLIAALVSLLAITNVQALEQKPKAWFGGSIDGPFTFADNWRFNFYVQSRFGDNASKFEEFIVRPSVYYAVTNQAALWFGYDLRAGVSSSRVSALRQQRIWPQLTYKKRYGIAQTLSLRSRLELRWREDSSQMAPRFRQRIEYSFNNVIKPDVTLDVYDEIFFSLHNADWVQPQLVNQNRIFIGFIKPMTNYSDIDIGYMNTYRPRSGEDRMDHTLVVAVSIDIDKAESSPILAF